MQAIGRGRSRAILKVLALLAVWVGLMALSGPAQAAPGDLDPTFDGDGKVITPINPANNDYANALVLQPDGKLVAAGYCWISTIDFCLARYNPDGSLDVTFDGDGKVTTHFGGDNQVNDLILQPDGKLASIFT